MGGHNRTYPSLRWVGLDDEQIVRMNGSWDGQSSRILKKSASLSCLFGLFGLSRLFG
jgi:hypothetical protein